MTLLWIPVEKFGGVYHLEGLQSRTLCGIWTTGELLEPFSEEAIKFFQDNGGCDNCAVELIKLLLKGSR